MKRVFFYSATVCLLSFTAKAQTEEVTVDGDVGKPFRISAATFGVMKTAKVKVTDHDGKEHEYSGIPLYDIITNAEAVPDNQLKGKALTKFLLVTAADGYQVVISLAEIDPAYTDRVILLANREDGEDLPANFGPFRLIVPGDKRPARSAMRVISMSVLTAKK